ncbi:pyrroloquinoline quinone biosynthesis protein PqqE [Streptomyces sp. NPDC090306]|uniref:pyrroloquinoline quinone biosynthesis protein PqqE n=1 Tax=Streptomyces sp. NPDC090306 TaxID=3365961 RepID=UPI0038051D9F
MTPPPPWALLAELTHACPLHCGYCSNPLELARKSTELTAAEWADVFRQAAGLGILHTHLSGGEPLLRTDLEDIVAAAEQAGVYTQLVTSGVGLDRARLARLADAGLRSVQLSVQHSDATASDRIAGRTASFRAKENAAGLVRDAGLPLGVNVVLHRLNLDAVDDLVQLALDWGADRIELANTQFYGWGLLNRDALMPTRDQVEEASKTVDAWRSRLDGAMEIVWVVPDYFDGRPKPCMGGWGAVSLTVTPDGTVLPCPASADLPGLAPDNVREHGLRWIWEESHSFNLYRGTTWMPSPCRTCDLRDTDFGGCRCQAFALTGDAARTDPACALSPDHHKILEQAEGPRNPGLPVIARRPGASRAVLLAQRAPSVP